MSFLDRSERDARAKAAEYSTDWKKWAELNPALAEYMTAEKWPDGVDRQTSTVLLFVEDGLVKICLNDRETGRSLWTSSGSIEGAFEALDGLLQAGSVPWRMNRGANGNGSTKKRGK